MGHLEDATSEQRYAHLCRGFIEKPDVTVGAGKGFGSDALMVGGRIFALYRRGRLTVKLPAARVAWLVAEGWGVPFDANKGRPMREWFVIAPGREHEWPALAEEALAFVRPPVSSRARPRRQAAAT